MDTQKNGRSVQAGITSFGLLLALSVVSRASQGLQPAFEPILLIFLGVPAYALGYTFWQVRSARRTRTGRPESELALALGDLSFVFTVVGLVIFGAINGLSRRVEDGALVAFAIVHLFVMALVLGVGWAGGQAMQRLTTSVARARALPAQPAGLPRTAQRALQMFLNALSALWRLVKHLTAYAITTPFFAARALVSSVQILNRWLTQLRERIS